MRIANSMPPIGFQPETIDARVTMRGGAAALGDVLVFDMDQGDAGTDSVIVGDSGSVFANVKDPVDGTPAASGTVQRPWVVGVALEAIADDAVGKVRIHGVCDAFVRDAHATTLAIAVGDELGVNSASEFEAGSPTGTYLYAIALQAVASGSAGTRSLASVLVVGDASLGRSRGYAQSQ